MILYLFFTASANVVAIVTAKTRVIFLLLMLLLFISMRYLLFCYVAVVTVFIFTANANVVAIVTVIGAGCTNKGDISIADVVLVYINALFTFLLRSDVAVVTVFIFTAYANVVAIVTVIAAGCTNKGDLLFC